MCSGKFSYKTGIISPANYPCLVRKNLPWHLHDSSMQQLYPCRYNFALLSSFDRYCCKKWNGSTAYRGFQRARETSFYMRRPERLTMFFRGTATYICNGKEIIPSKLIWGAWKVDENRIVYLINWSRDGMREKVNRIDKSNTDSFSRD